MTVDPNGRGRVRRFVEGHRLAVALTAYAGVVGAAWVLAYLLRFDFAVPAEQGTTLALALPLLLFIRLATFRLFRLTRGRWRFVGTGEIVSLLGATATGSAIFLALATLLPFSPRVPRSVFLLEWFLVTFLTAGLWIGYRIVFERARKRRSEGGAEETPAVVVGAGEAGNMLVKEMLRFPTGYRPVAFVDDDPLKWGTALQGVEVVGGTQDLPEIARALGAQEVILALPSASPGDLRRLARRCEETGLPFKVLPGIAEVLEEKRVEVAQLRELRIEDLLGREPVRLELPELEEELGGRRVLITGAAGSIGSELARQVALHGPERLVILDQAETDLYYVDLELRARHPELEIVPVVADILDRGRLDGVFRRHRPERVFHAAAYKHVPMMEHNVCEAAGNNLVGTWRVAQAAGVHGAERFVLISTDKAVDPSSVMGLTKRGAELVVLALQAVHQGTHYMAVRFGNVLGSNGSVIPLFQRQIEEGGPVTVTHPDVTRYFMTIAEAVQLVLKASTLAEARGRIAMLEMGEPVRIVDLARNLIRLSGFEPEEDVAIRFTGLRPGEKLHERLTAGEEASLPTGVDRVRLVETTTNGTRPEAMLEAVESLDALRAGLDDEDLRRRLVALVSPDPGRREMAGASGAR